MTTKTHINDVSGIIMVLKYLAEAIRQAKEIPSGNLYAMGGADKKLIQF